MAREHVVRQGECLASIALRYGFFPDTLWNHPDNADLKARREDPDVLLPGDVVVVPELRVRRETAATEATHRFRRKGVPKKVKVVFSDWRGEPHRHTGYRLDVDGRLSEGTTDGDGALEEGIPPDARRVEIVFASGHEYTIELGRLDPVSETVGVQQRLANLGFYRGGSDGDLDDATREALREFQASQGLAETGEPDDATRDALVAANGS